MILSASVKQGKKPNDAGAHALDFNLLQPKERLDGEETLIAIAVYIGKTREIDNIIVR